MKNLKKFFQKPAVQIAMTILIVIAGMIYISPITYNLLDDRNPPQLIDISNNSDTYKLIVDPNSGYYEIHELKGEKGKALVASAPDSLQKYVNKKVKITGKIVWTHMWLKAPGYQQDQVPSDSQTRDKAVGVKIDSITLAE